MNRSCFFGFVLSLPLAFAAASCGPTSAAPGQDAAHSQDAGHEHDAPHEREPTSTTVFGERLRLFMEYPHLVRGVSARFLAHLTVLESGEPVRAGSVTLEFGESRLTVDAPERDGVFIPEGSFPQAGSFPARLIVKRDQLEDRLELGEIVVHADQEGADHAAHEAATGEQPNQIPFLLEPQWKVKLLLAQAGKRTLTKRLIVPARALAPEGMSAVVSAPLGGRLSAPEAASLPRTGEPVTVGQTLALLEPPLAAPELAQLQALALEFDLKSLDVLRAASEAKARLGFAEREHARISSLRAEGLSTQQQLELAEQNMSLAKTELEAARGMQESLERLVAQRGSNGPGLPAATLRVPIQAPIAGTIIEVLAVPGQSVEAGAPIFRILNSSRMWIEGRVSEFDLSMIGAVPVAVATLAALPARRFELGGPPDAKPYLGPLVDAASRTLSIRYELDNSDGAVRPGMLAELEIATGKHEARVAIPLEAIVMDQGLPTAYVMLEGELFGKRELELGAKDAAFVEVLSGIEPGEHVATRGAYIVKLAALSPETFGAGHAH